jgi:hypothetical protein
MRSEVSSLRRKFYTKSEPGFVLPRTAIGNLRVSLLFFKIGTGMHAGSL